MSTTSREFPKPGVDNALQTMAIFLECSEITPRHLMTFLLVASRGPVLLSQLNTQSPLSQKNFDEPVAFLSQRDQGEQFSAVITVFSAVDGRDKWIALTARGRELFSLIQRSAYSSRIAA